MEPVEVHEESSLVATFHVGGSLLGIATERIQEIIKIGAITDVPHAPSHILGILNLRGRIVTVIDLGARLALQASPRGEPGRIIILDDGGESVGFLVDHIADVIPVAPQELIAPPANMKAAQGDYFDKVYYFHGGLVGLLKVDTVFEASICQEELSCN